jgi:AcrR family transcriptional regulator
LFAKQDPVDEMADKVLDAAFAQFVAFGIRRTTMEDVAKRAGVSRITVYRRFADKNRLVESVMLREARRFFTEFGHAVDRLPNLEERFAEGVVVTLRFARANPLLSRMLDAEPDAILPHLTIGAGPLVTIARVYLAGRLREWQEDGAVPPALSVDPVAEVLVRLALSFVLTRDSCFPLDDEDALRRLLKESARFALAPLAKSSKSAKVEADAASTTKSVTGTTPRAAGSVTARKATRSAKPTKAQPSKAQTSKATKGKRAPKR